MASCERTHKEEEDGVNVARTLKIGMIRFEDDKI
jgi:hypothetical protein